MTPSRPYLIRGFYEWICDNAKTPYILVNAESENVIVPREYVKQGKIVLNISPDATYKLLVTNDAVEFQATFSHVSRQVYIPIASVEAIYAQENGAGMVFGSEPGGDGREPPPTENGGNGTSSKKPALSLVK